MKKTKITLVNRGPKGAGVEETIVDGYRVGHLTLHNMPDMRNSWAISFGGLRITWVNEKLSVARKLAEELSPIFDAYINRDAMELNADKETIQHIGGLIQGVYNRLGFVPDGFGVRLRISLVGVRL